MPATLKIRTIVSHLLFGFLHYKRLFSILSIVCCFAPTGHSKVLLCVNFLGNKRNSDSDSEQSSIALIMDNPPCYMRMSPFLFFFCNGGSREVTEAESCLGGLKVKPLVVTPTLTGLLTPRPQKHPLTQANFDSSTWQWPNVTKRYRSLFEQRFRWNQGGCMLGVCHVRDVSEAPEQTFSPEELISMQIC